ncbi:hypothetical protein CK203_033343 [Vitis vinifera]|uniref:Reverse transcriptase Ty1/copia-type domain-containing protein n=1 Tax=Vitis vinifera TaxID=29760 RepID=A0A438HMR6_VITVI|nr:hypothetical protein CK203_033343 [Vitis vinifera]
MGPESCLAKEFEIMDLGKLQYFLGIEVARSNQGLLILKGSIVQDLVKEIAPSEGVLLKKGKELKLKAYTNVD